MKTTHFLSQIALLTTILLNISSNTYASAKHTEMDTVAQQDLMELSTPSQKLVNNDAYLMVMSQQVEKGDQSITFAFYMDQMTDLYKASQRNSDFDINIQMEESIQSK
jgi:hypothetical protein